MEEKKVKYDGIYWFNLILTVAMLVLLHGSSGTVILHLYGRIPIALIVNFRSVKEQSKKIKEYGSNAMVGDSYSVCSWYLHGCHQGLRHGRGNGTDHRKCPSGSDCPHMHWFMAIFSVPLMMILDTDAFYYALLPIIIGVVEPFGVTPEVVAATFLLQLLWQIRSAHP